ncbi:MAG: tRNA (adenosine(37)-N6)-threonylcarbamoyltransferase complex ATPase subunit type 1 TsaE [Bifidobacterium sp.]|uniref:tRNA threonylcarbamoyladenosine biosynthesis protein TsaE n=3 Tax=Bifidobacterium TaxID=1678 RepID=A0AB39UEX5_9BIFI
MAGSGTAGSGTAEYGTAEAARPLRIEVPSDTDMRSLGSRLAGLVQGGDVIVLSGPLGAGKTTLAQGFGRGLGIEKPIVSPTFTIARELNGKFADGRDAHLIHVDAYRLGSEGFEPGDGIRNRLLDELESLGLDEELESPGESSVVLMEWGERMAQELAPERLEIHIERPSGTEPSNAAGNASAGSSVDKGTYDKGAYGPGAAEASQRDEELTSNGTREVCLRGVGSAWAHRMQELREAL